MYESHFGISGPPFQLSPDPSFYFDSKGHHEVRDSLRQSLEDESGFVVISGEIGAGKTTLIRTLLAELDPSRLVVGQVLSTQLEADDLLRAIVITFGIPGTPPDAPAMLRALESHLASLTREGRRAVLIVDEAQNLHVSAFEMLVQLEKGGAAGRPALKLCLVGQPELRDILKSAPLVALRDRVSVSCHIGPLGVEETGAYIQHRLRKVGWTGIPSFESAAFEEIHRWTGGIPRRVNLLCNRLMLSRFLTQQTRIDVQTVTSTAADLRAEMGDTSSPPPVATPRSAVASPPAQIAAAEQASAGPAGAVAVASNSDTPVSRTGAAAAARRDPPLLTSVVPQGDARPLVFVAASQADHLQVAALLRAIAARNDLPVCLLVRAYANNAFERNREMFAGLDIDGRIVPLGIGGGTYAGRAAELMQRFEFVADQCQPAAVVVFDGSDAALSCGLVASRRSIPVVHVGAGLRVRGQPGAADITRKLTDQLADVLYTSDIEASERLVREGTARDRVAFVGNLQVDALQIALRSSIAGGPRERAGLPAEYLSDRNGYGVVVLDAPANVNDRQTMSELVAILREVSRDVPLVWPMHTRMREQLVKFKLDATMRGERVACLAEQGYVSFVQLLANATCVLTDSWHVQEEATALGLPCLALGSESERPIASAVGSTIAVGRNKAIATRTIWDCIFNGGKRGSVPDQWDGQTGARIADHLALWLRAAAPRAAPEADALSRVS